MAPQSVKMNGQNVKVPKPKTPPSPKQGKGWNTMRNQYNSQGRGASGKDWLESENLVNPSKIPVINKATGKRVTYQNATGKPKAK